LEDGLVALAPRRFAREMRLELLVRITLEGQAVDAADDADASL
jgi:hypothetical protein